MGTPEGRNLGQLPEEQPERFGELPSVSSDVGVEENDQQGVVEQDPDHVAPLGDDFKTRGMHSEMYGDETPTNQFGNDL